MVVVVAQLVEQSLPTPEFCGSNPVNRTLLYRTFVYCQLYRKDKNEKEAGIGPFKKDWSLILRSIVKMPILIEINFSKKI